MTGPMEANVPLQEWINSQTVGDEMLWKGSWGRQLEFFRDTIARLFGWGMDYADYEDAKVARVISTHRSKSIVLPVYKLHRGDLGLTMVFRNNFYNWKMSVVSEVPIIADFAGLFHTTPPVEPDYTGNPLASVYFEGFPKQWIFDYYCKDNKQFSAEIGGNHALWASVFTILKARGVVKPAEWHTRESHRKKLDAERAKSDARDARLKKEEEAKEKNK